VLLFEHEGKAVLREHGIATPRGMVVQSVADVGAAARTLTAPFMIKSQVLTGGRGMAGFIIAADDTNALQREANAMFGATISDLPVRKLLVEERVAIGQNAISGYCWTARRCC
jgi:succinyl-CoA synthetase beta subunit